MNLASSLQNEGFVLAKGLIPIDVITKVMSEVEAVVDRQMRIFELTPTSDSLHDKLAAIHAHDIASYLKLISALSRLLVFEHILHHPNIIDVLNRELGYQSLFKPDGTIFNLMSKRLRIPNGYFGFEPHQDWATTQGSEESMVIWVPLVDVDEHRFPLQVLPGSHQQGLLPLEDLGYVRATRAECFDEADFINVTCEAGDVIFMDSYMLHRTGKQGDERLRIACSTRFDRGDNTEFVRQGYPCAIRKTLDTSRYDNQ